MRKKWIRRLKYMLLKFFRIRGSAHSISIGFTLGASINFVPSFGIGLIISVAFAKLFRGNSIAAFIGGISLVWFFPFLFYLNMVTGEFIYPHDIGEVIENAVEDAAVLNDPVMTGLSIGRTFLIGMIINMLLFIFSLYPAIYILFKRYQKRILHFIYEKWVKKQGI
ncbi:DUF2062 domain-containing protein [Bacillus aerolatus]|uniref:DUF2062 domain-containing protein n=1 Tax=Bacillus aerolatus TaxID=2653354 RepID=A0A6I1FJ41_9BACI|nr:DUF2062 domain-containing protein [Bacillus aerolatus]KAB7708600.1 DUF2062 domain-containing protein [Bacillus aerolatus]